ncbi:MAG: metal-sensing transcriptional repressor [Betaproteobacteria bacterium]|nr:metal-sensing transcriptional repressor [Betaproteobacteria bacterium]
MTTHTSHPDVLKRLKRAQGHLKGIVTMLEEGRGCLDIAQQLLAVEKAIGNAKRILVHDHIDHCLENTVKDGSVEADVAVREFKEITKYL